MYISKGEYQMIVIDAIIRSKRKTVSLIISPQGKLIVHAPVNCPLNYIESIVKKRSDWITKNQSKISARNEANQNILNYKNVLYMGKVYRLALADNITSITLYGNAIYIPHKTPKDKIKRNLVKWYKVQALEIAQQRVSLYANIMHLMPKNISINNTKTSWGLCNNKKEIKLNWRIIMLPLELVDYVAVHELAHLIEFNHSKRFWQVVLNVLPDTAKRKKELKKGDFLLQLFRD